MERIIWIDGDIVITNPIKEFYYQDFKGSMIIAIEDMLNRHNNEKKDELGIPRDELYFSSGVMLYNLNKMRNVMTVESIFDYIHKNVNKIEYVDQDVFNALFYNQTFVMEKGFKYNYFAPDVPAYGYRKTIDDISVAFLRVEETVENGIPLSWI